MIYYKYDKNYINKKKTKLRLFDFVGRDDKVENDFLPIRYVRDTYGFMAMNGNAVSSFGIHELTSTTGSSYSDIQFGFDNIYPFFVDGVRQILASSKGRGFALNEETKSWDILPGIYFSGEDAVLMTVGKKPVMIIPKEDGGLFKYDGYNVVDMNINIAPTSMCSHMNRLFVVDKADGLKLKYSALDEPFNFDISLSDGGEIYLDAEDGNIVGLKSYNGKLYIFREYAIYALTGYADQRQFTLRKVANTSSRINSKCISLCGNYFIFLDNEGLKMFDGYNIREMMPELRESLQNIVVTSANYFNGNYYMAYKKGENTSYVLYVELGKHRYYILDNTSVNKFVVLREVSHAEELAVLLNNNKRIGIIDNSGISFGKPIRAYMKTTYIGFGEYDRLKNIVGFTVPKSDKYTIMIENDKGGRRQIVVDGKHRYYSVGMSGYYFKFTITSTGYNVIHSPIMTVEV